METFHLVGGVAVAILGLTVHESAHAFVADRLGDPTPRLTGRLTLNPIVHIDLIWTILLPAFLLMSGSPMVFGGAKPVLTQPHYFRRPSRDMALVAAAGPLCNLLQAFLWAFLLNLFLRLGVWDEHARGLFILQIGITINVLLLLLNALPLPPFDGSKILLHFLRGEARRRYMALERFSLFILIAVFFFLPGFRPLLQSAMLWTGNLVASLAGLPPTIPWWPVLAP